MRKTKALLVGCGSIHRSWLAGIKDFKDVEIAGLMDINRESAENSKKTHELTNALVFTDLDEALATVNPDVVFDCTLPEIHKQVMLKAASAGCHILGEKPMAVSVSEAQEMIKAAKANNITHAVIQNRRYMNEIVAFRDFLKSGRLGKLTTLNADFYLGCHFGGFRDVMEHVLLLDMAIHSFDQARFISGCDPVSVYCHEWNPQGSWYEHAASAICIFEMSDGVVFTYRGSWCAEGLKTSWQCDWRAICTGGTAKWNGEQEMRAEKVAGGEGFMREMASLEIHPVELKYKNHSGNIREFLDCLKNGTAPQTVGTDNIKSLAMVEAAVKSAETGQKVGIKW
jgi:predicted dehydrogenase